MLRKTLALILVCLLALSWLPQTASAMMTMEEERKLGKEAFDEIVVAIPLVDDPDTVNYVRDLGKVLVAELPEKLFDYQFYVANEPDMNAFAIPGGYIFMFRGMMTSMENEAELAGVLAHEIGHVWRRHIAKRIEKSQPASIASVAGMLAGAVLGGLMGAPALGQALSMGSLAGGQQAQLAFSREDEQEADWAAFKLMSQAGYEPKEMVKSFHRIWRQERTTMPSIPVYLRTHPTSPSRMEFVENMVRTHPVTADKLDNDAFLRVQMRLVALYEKPENARDALAAKRREQPNSPYPVYGQALLEMRNGQYNEAIKNFASLPANWSQHAYAVREQGICHLRLGQYEQAETYLNKALALAPGDALTLVSLARTYSLAQQYDRAEQVLRRILASTPDNDEALYELGMALGRGGRTAEASFYLGMAFKERRSWRAARFHLERASRELTNRPDLAERADKALKEMEKAGRDGRRPGPEDQQHNPATAFGTDQGVDPAPWEGRGRSTPWGQETWNQGYSSGSNSWGQGNSGFSFEMRANDLNDPMPLDERMRRNLNLNWERGPNPLDYDPYRDDPRARPQR